MDEEIVTHSEVKRRELLNAGQHKSLATLYLGRGCTLLKKDLKKGLELFAEIRRAAKDVDVGQLKRDANKVFRMVSELISISDPAIAIFARVSKCIDACKLSRVFVPEDW